MLFYHQPNTEESSFHAGNRRNHRTLAMSLLLLIVEYIPKSHCATITLAFVFSQVGHLR
jgi:hypothetical protein